MDFVDMELARDEEEAEEREELFVLPLWLAECIQPLCFKIFGLPSLRCKFDLYVELLDFVVGNDTIESCFTMKPCESYTLQDPSSLRVLIELKCCPSLSINTG